VLRDLIPPERRNRILEILRTQGSVRVSTLGELLGVAEITIRRDLERLERQGLLERTHGGAIYSHRMRLEPRYNEKHLLHQDEKRDIGAAAAALVEDGDTLFINSGSTALQILRHLTGRDVQIITSNMGVGLDGPGLGLDIMLTGGTYREQSNSLVGPMAILTLQQVYSSKCFIGVDGISPRYGLTTPTLQEAEVARTMIERTRGEVVVVADHTKFGVVSNYLTAPLDKVDRIVTDAGFSEDYRSDIEAAGIEIILAAVPLRTNKPKE
jgi:DeoR family fructose operon transcriptional repressor